MIGFLIFLSIILLFLLIPCGICAAYSNDGISARLIVGPIRINLLRSEAKKTKKPKVEKKTEKYESHEKVKETKKIADFWPVLKLILNFLIDFKRKLIVNNLRFKMILGDSDPYRLSLNYGRYWAVIGNLMPHLESCFTIKKRNIEIECDYTKTDTKIDAAIDLRLTLGTLLHMVLHHGIRILVKYFKISNQTKDGAVS